MKVKGELAKFKNDLTHYLHEKLGDDYGVEFSKRGMQCHISMKGLEWADIAPSVNVKTDWTWIANYDD